MDSNTQLRIQNERDEAFAKAMFFGAAFDLGTALKERTSAERTRYARLQAGFVYRWGKISGRAHQFLPFMQEMVRKYRK